MPSGWERGAKPPNCCFPTPWGSGEPWGTAGGTCTDILTAAGGDIKVPAMAPGAVPCLSGTEAVAARGSQNTPSPPGPQLAVKIT